MTTFRRNNIGRSVGTNLPANCNSKLVLVKGVLFNDEALHPEHRSLEAAPR